MSEILYNSLVAERIGNWILHLKSMNDMLPYFAASGHYLYAKSTYLHLQDMINLQYSHPNVFKSFFDGLFVVRRYDRLWSGRATDLVIEQD